MDKLTQLAIKYGTDKWGKHHYTPVYYDLFKDRRESVKKVLEIGVGEGAGLRMWRDFFPNAQIYGAENDPARLFRDNRIEVFECDQTDGNSLRWVIAKIGFDIDLVIDDGSHRHTDQIFSCVTLMEWLLGNTIYVIEDVADAAIAEKLAYYDCSLIVANTKRYDDSLLVVRHKNG